MGWGFPQGPPFHLQDKSLSSVLLLPHFPVVVEAQEK